MSAHSLTLQRPSVRASAAALAALLLAALLVPTVGNQATATAATRVTQSAEPVIRVGALSREGLGAGQDVGYFLVDPKTGSSSARQEIYQGHDHRLSPNGTTVATSLPLNVSDHTKPAGFAITLQNLGNNTERILIEDFNASGPPGLAWSADSTRLFYITDGFLPTNGASRRNPPRLWTHPVGGAAPTSVSVPAELSYKRVMGDLDDGSLLVETFTTGVYRLVVSGNAATATRVVAPTSSRDALVRSVSFDPFSDRIAIAYDGSRAPDATAAEKERTISVLDLATNATTDWGPTFVATHDILLLPGAGAVLYHAVRSDGFTGYTALIRREASGAETELTRPPSSEPGLRAHYEQMSAAVASGTVAPPPPPPGNGSVGASTLTLTSSTARVLQRFQLTRLSGSLTPAHPDAFLTVQVNRGSGWRDVGIAKLDRDSNYTYTWISRTRGRYLIRTVFAGSDKAQPSTSPELSVMVR